MGKHTREISWVSYFNDEFSLVAFIEDLYQSPGDHVVACSSSSVLAGIIEWWLLTPCSWNVTKRRALVNLTPCSLFHCPRGHIVVSSRNGHHSVSFTVSYALVLASLAFVNILFVNILLPEETVFLRVFHPCLPGDRTRNCMWLVVCVC